MAYHETNLQKIKKLVIDPRKNAHKIIPFIKNKIFPYQRDFYEFFGSEKYSKPYLAQDLLIKYLDQKNGFFVQCGGNDGYSSDPTYFLEKFLNWTGIIIEPLPIYYLCQRNRKKSKVYNHAAVSFDYERDDISFFDCHGMSIVKDSIPNQEEWLRSGELAQDITAREISVVAKPVQTAIDDYFSDHPVRQIDLLVADVEGYELNVLKGLDFVKNSPIQIMVEIHTPERKKDIDAYLKERGYQFVAELYTNDFLYKK